MSKYLTISAFNNPRSIPEEILLSPLNADENEGLVLTNTPPYDVYGLFEHSNNGKYARWDNINLTGIKSFDIRYAAHSSAVGGGFTIRLGSPSGTIIGTFQTQNTGGWLTFTETQRVEITETTGTHSIYIVFFEAGNVFTGIGAMNFEYLRFTTNEPEGTEPPPPDPDPEEEPTHWVLTTGVDSAGRNGTTGQEWRTLVYAFSRLASSPGSILGIGPGTFTETSYPIPPLGVSVKGSGIGVTELRLHSSLFAEVRNGGHMFQFSKAYFYMSHANDVDGNQFFSDFTINGQKNSNTGIGVYGGFHIDHRRNVTIKRVEIHNTCWTPVFVMRLFSNGGFEMHDCNIHDAAQCIQIGQRNDGIYIHHNFLSANYRPPDMPNNSIGRAMAFLAQDSPNGFYRNIRFCYNDCRSLSNFDLCVEPYVNANGVTYSNIEIDHNYMNGGLSCVANYDNDPSTGQIQWRIHHNIIEALQGNSFCIELNINDAEIYENYLFGGISYPIVNFNPPARSKRHWRIHNNVIYNMNTPSYTQGIVRCQYAHMDDVHIINNTIHQPSFQNNRIILCWCRSQGGTNPNMSNILIRNNLIWDQASGTMENGGTIVRKEGSGSASNIVVTHNYMFNTILGPLPMTQNNNVINTTTAPGLALTPDDRQKTFADVDNPLPAYYTPSNGGNLDGTGFGGANIGAL